VFDRRGPFQVLAFLFPYPEALLFSSAVSMLDWGCVLSDRAGVRLVVLSLFEFEGLFPRCLSSGRCPPRVTGVEVPEVVDVRR
jgi:hypothetical protein